MIYKTLQRKQKINTNPTKNLEWTQLLRSGRAISSCSTSVTRHVTKSCMWKGRNCDYIKRNISESNVTIFQHRSLQFYAMCAHMW